MVNKMGQLNPDIQGTDLIYNVGAINANASITLQFADNVNYGFYAPYDAVNVFNNRAGLIVVYPNQASDRGYPVPGNTERPITGLKLNSMRITEASGAGVNANEIRLILIKTGATPDTLTKKIARVFGRSWF